MIWYNLTAGKVLQLNLEHPDFFKAVGTHVAELSDADWKAYLTWNLVHSLSEYVSNPALRPR